MKNIKWDSKISISYLLVMSTSANMFSYSFQSGCVREFFLQVCLVFLDPQGSEKFVIENGIMKGVEEDVFIWQNGYGDWILKKLRATPDFVGQVRSNFFISFVIAYG